MISGPTIPNTLESIRDLLVHRVDLIEHGLRVISEDLVLGHDAAVDVLACDATGAPVMQFIAVPETAGQLPARVLGAQAWWRQNAGFLARELSDPHLRIELTPRFLVDMDIRAALIARPWRPGLTQFAAGAKSCIARSKDRGKVCPDRC